MGQFSNYKNKRGMSIYHDWVDWLGGYPFEVAKPEDIVFMGEKGDYLSPTFHLPHDFTQNDFQMVEDWCKQYPHWSTPLNPWQYFNVMRVTRIPKFGKFKIKQ